MLKTNVCRFCGERPRLVVEIWTQEQGGVDLPTLISEHLPIQASASDGLPSRACSACVKLLQTWHSFTQLCRRTDARLRAELYEKGESHDLGSDDTQWTGENTISQPCLENSENDDKKMRLGNRLRRGTIPASPFSQHSSKKEDIKEDIGKDSLATPSQAIELSISRSNRAQCHMCGIMVGGRYNIEHHILTNHYQLAGNRGLECDVCKKLYSRKSSLTVHLKTHFPDLAGGSKKHSLSKMRAIYMKMNLYSFLYSCDKCPKKFPTKLGLIGHVTQSHKAINYLRCKFCPYFCQTHRNLVLHVDLHHKEATCTVCLDTFKDFDSLAMHKATHIAFPNEGNFKQCEVCGKVFSSVSGVTQHLTCHSRRFSCKFCGVNFSKSCDCQEHEISVHSDVKEFLCSECGLSFSTKNLMRSHKSRVHDYQLVPCHICSKIFKKTDVSRHIRRHGMSEVPSRY